MGRLVVELPPLTTRRVIRSSVVDDRREVKTRQNGYWRFIPPFLWKQWAPMETMGVAPSPYVSSPKQASGFHAEQHVEGDEVQALRLAGHGAFPTENDSKPWCFGKLL